LKHIGRGNPAHGDGLQLEDLLESGSNKYLRYTGKYRPVSWANLPAYSISPEDSLKPKVVRLYSCRASVIHLNAAASYKD